MQIRFTIPGCPIPKQRARKGAGGRWYTPKKTRAYMDRVRGLAWINKPIGNVWPKDATYRVQLDIYFPDNRTRDLDNVCKGVLDALNSCLWDDDSSVHEIVMNRHLDKEKPRVEVEVQTL